MLVTLANFYDVLIDCPAAGGQLKSVLQEWVDAGVIKKEFEAKCVAHLDTVKKELDSEYAN